MSYIIKVWETEELRDMGESLIINSTEIDTLKEAIDEAKEIMEEQQFASLEVQDEAEEKSFYFCTPREEEYIYNDILRDEENVKKIQEVTELYFVENNITNRAYYETDENISRLSISKIYKDILKKLNSVPNFKFDLANKVFIDMLDKTDKEVYKKYLDIEVVIKAGFILDSLLLEDMDF